MKNMRTLIVNTYKGFSLVEVTIAMAVSAIVIGGVMATLNLVSQGNTKSELIQARSEIINDIRIQSLNINNLTQSAELTNSLGSTGVTPDYGPTSTLLYPQLLRNCLPNISNTPSAGCDKTSLEEPGKGYLFYLTSNESNDPEKAIAGEDIYYRNTGMRCTSVEAANPTLCPLMARTWFEPFCLNFAANCNKAMSLLVRYAVGMRSDYTGEDVIPTLSSEFYIPLQKGVQIRNLLSQTDMPLYSNSNGIFVIPKYYGFTGQYIEGLRFEVTISNPDGLTFMRLQGRSLTGPEAKLFDDSKVPDELTQKAWEDIPTPSDPNSGPWSVDLTGAGPNQTFNFGTQANVGANSRIPTAFTIGKSKSDILDPKYHWTLNADGTDYISPSFKSGFYQFRVLTKDALGGEIESSNYITVRLVSIPEFEYVIGNFTLSRDCVNTSSPFSLFVGDDEAISFSQIKLNGTIQSTPTILGNKAQLNFDFLTNQPAGDYPVVLTLKNLFSDVSMETGMIPRVEDTKIINLTDVSVTSSITNNPEKIRYLSTGQISSTYSAGNCCNAIPKATWSFLSSPDFGGVPLLAENSTNSSADFQSTMACTTTGNIRSCNTTITAKGIKESPNLPSPPNDISAVLDLGAESNNPACQFSSSNPSGDSIGKFIPVVNLPTIRFYLTESLWLHNIPAGPATSSLSSSSIKPSTPRVYIRMDFAPTNNVEVYVVDAANPTNILCDPITFVADGSTNPTDKFCDLNSTNFSGILELRRKDNLESTAFNKIVYAGETTCIFTSGCDAQIAGTVHHTICQRNFTDPAKKLITDFPMPPSLLIKSNVEMRDSPYGLNPDGTQHAKNDYAAWTVDRKKQLRCYDNWSLSTSPSKAFNLNTNKQDYYDVYRYNNEERLSLAPIPPPIHYKLANPSSPSPTSIHFQAFSYPINNGSLDYSADNIPFLYMISQSGDPEKIVWISPNTEISARTTTGKQSWEDVTSGLNCNGLSNNVKLFRVRPNINWNTPNLTIKSIGAMMNSNDDQNDRFSYLFMCDYGRWHPSSPNDNNWTD